tara:strand:- start:7654 stop:8859 length:1206 start_codon:yes stop_codon:yes gene_type:complete
VIPFFQKIKINKKIINLMIIFCSLFILIIFKAKNTEITVDEAYSFLNYSYVGDYLNIGIANNHILNSYLMYLFQNIGYSELILRLPNILFGLIYLLVVFQISKRTKNYIFSSALLFLNPYLIDFFSIARGYGISTSLIFLALYLYTSSKEYSLIWPIILLSISTLSYHVSVVYLIIFWFVNLKEIFTNEKKILTFFINVIVVATSVVNIYILFIVTSIGKPLYGVVDPPILSILSGFFGLHGLYMNKSMLFKLFLSILFLLPILSFNKFEKNTKKILLISYSSLFSIYLIPYILDKPIPLLRTVLPFLPPILFLVVEMSKIYFKNLSFKYTNLISTITILALLSNFVNNIELRKTIDWKDGVPSKEILAINECGYVVPFYDLDSVGQYYRLLDKRTINTEC